MEIFNLFNNFNHSKIIENVKKNIILLFLVYILFNNLKNYNASLDFWALVSPTISEENEAEKPNTII
jgi:hypothetical protein